MAASVTWQRAVDAAINAAVGVGITVTAFPSWAVLLQPKLLVTVSPGVKTPAAV
jgi:hypothetical protein